MFSTLGPDTFKELRQAWACVDNFAHVMSFIDMHDIGDELLRQGFSDPVIDMEHLQLHYPNLEALIAGLKRQGVRNINASRNPGLTGAGNWLKFKQEIEKCVTADFKYPLTYEVVYGHGWKLDRQINYADGKTAIPVSQIKKRPIP